LDANILVVDLPAQCSDYMILDEADRSVTNNNGGCRDDDGNDLCYADEEDRTYTSAQWKGEGYYRFQSPAGTQLPEYSPGPLHCGTSDTVWLSGTHPDQVGVELQRTVCIADRGNKHDCFRKKHISVTNCKGYYVYYFQDIFQDIPARYCGTNPN
jgi:hypothetical protein